MGDDCLFKCTFTYASLPLGFFERFMVGLRRHSTHMEFSTYSAAFYRMGTKIQVFVIRDSKNDYHPTGMEFFPGLHTVAFEFTIADNEDKRKNILSKFHKAFTIADNEDRRKNILSKFHKAGVGRQFVDNKVSWNFAVFAGLDQVYGNAHAEITARVHDFEKQLSTVHDPFQVVIIHSPNRQATELANCISSHLKEIEAGLAIEVILHPIP
ncbi:hypothetical protein T484DRAFT_1891957 [Baffinella frigidus]|nr:hypothetical protein T484DRAFT_1891957 [Cryptophyta sp. CCMP2293]